MQAKRVSLEINKLVGMVHTLPYQDLKARRVSSRFQGPLDKVDFIYCQDTGTSPQCILSELLDEYETKGEVDQEHEEDLMSVCAVVYGGICLYCAPYTQIRRE